jgi:Enterobacter phage Enc34, ssDNA-binding protein
MASLNTPYGTLSFPSLFQPRPRADGGEAVYSAVLIFSPVQQQDAAYKALQDAVIATAKEEWGDKVNLKELKMPFRDAGEKEGAWAGFQRGHMFISPWTKTKPGIVNAQRQDILLPEEVWGGQMVRMNLSPYAWINSGRKGVSFALNHVQVVRTDTPRLDGRGSATTVFDDGVVAEDDEETPF